MYYNNYYHTQLLLTILNISSSQPIYLFDCQLKGLDFAGYKINYSYTIKCCDTSQSNISHAIFKHFGTYVNHSSKQPPPTYPAYPYPPGGSEYRPQQAPYPNQDTSNIQ